MKTNEPYNNFYRKTHELENELATLKEKAISVLKKYLDTRQNKTIDIHLKMNEIKKSSAEPISIKKAYILPDGEIGLKSDSEITYRSEDFDASNIIGACASIAESISETEEDSSSDEIIRIHLVKLDYDINYTGPEHKVKPFKSKEKAQICFEEFKRQAKEALSFKYKDEFETMEDTEDSYSIQANNFDEWASVEIKEEEPI